MRELTDLIDADVAGILDTVDLSPLDGRSVLITGASGLLGTYLLACLARRMRETGKPIDVTAVMRSAPVDAVAGFIDGNHIKAHQIDLADYDSVRSLPAAEFVIHAAGYGQPGKFMEDPAKTIRLNTTATLQLLEKLPEGGKFLYLSSSEIYSGSTHLPHNENDIGTTGPGHFRACYIEGKRCGEAICQAYRNNGVEARSARLALAYGPGTRTDDQRVLNSFIRRALQEKQLTLMDHGLARRTYGYITDVTEMLFSILLRGREAVYNVGGVSGISVLDLARAIGADIGVPVNVPAQDANLAGAPSEVTLDLSLACNEFGKTAFVPMEEGLRRTIVWQRQLYGVPH